MGFSPPANRGEGEQQSARTDGLASGGAGSAPFAPSWLLVARLVRPHGRKGELIADVLTDFPEGFHSRHRLYLMPPGRIGTAPREVEVENFWFQRSRIVLKFQGVDSINEAENLRGFGVAIPAEARMPAEAGAAYVCDLVGCHVIDLNSAGGDVGEIVDVDRGSSSTDLLVVRRGGGQAAKRETLIPFVKDYLVRIDTEGRRVEMRLPEGLLEINAPMTEEEKHEASEKE
jgi:16S rRNA processing protein RimM